MDNQAFQFYYYFYEKKNEFNIRDNFIVVPKFHKTNKNILTKEKMVQHAVNK